MCIKSIIDQFITKAIDRADYRIGTDGYKNYQKYGIDTTQPLSGEKAWVNKWQPLASKRLSPISYRIHSHYIGENVNIVPFEVCRTVIEPILSPLQNEMFYNDKNSFGLLFEKDMMPFTIVHKINGLYFDDDYHVISIDQIKKRLDAYSRVILKPTSQCSGRGVSIFTKRDGLFVNKKGESLSNTIDSSNHDYIIQECVKQSSFMAQFNPSSVNTIRVSTYRDVKTGEIHVLGSAIRMGATGSDVDNLYAGGVLVGVNNDGMLNRVLIDVNGCETFVYNGLSFDSCSFQIPNYDKIKEFAIRVSMRLPHQKLLAHDIALDENDNPLLIEINSHWYNPSILQNTVGPLFGGYTDDVIEYCLKEKSKLRIKYTKVYNV